MSEVVTSLTTLASGKFRLIRDLIEGDPVAWSIVGGIIGIIVVFFVVRKAWNMGQPAAAEQRDDPANNDEPRAGV